MLKIYCNPNNFFNIYDETIVNQFCSTGDMSICESGQSPKGKNRNGTLGGAYHFRKGTRGDTAS